jgi:hypothetical protein
MSPAHWHRSENPFSMATLLGPLARHSFPRAMVRCNEATGHFTFTSLNAGTESAYRSASTSSRIAPG